MSDKQHNEAGHPDDPTDSLPVGDYVEEVSEGGRTVRRRGIYLLPNLFTTGTLFSGFYAIVAAMNGDFDKAAIAVFVAMFFDGMDGRIARMTRTQSAFGVQYDSLSDMVAFGVAPALVAFSWALAALGKVGWAIAFIYVAGAALRLARFNVQVATADKRYFTGLASPAAAAIVASLVWVGDEAGWAGAGMPGLALLAAALVTAAAGVLMITNIPYHSFKGINLKGRVPFVVFPAIVLALAVAMTEPARILLIIALVYMLSGPLTYLLRKPR